MGQSNSVCIFRSALLQVVNGVSEMNNTESKYNGMNNVISRKRRNNPWIAVPVSSVLYKPESAAELRGSGQEVALDGDSLTKSAEQTTDVITQDLQEPEAKHRAVSAAEADYVLSTRKEHEKEPAPLKTSVIDNTPRKTTSASSMKITTTRNFNPFLIDGTD